MRLGLLGPADGNLAGLAQAAEFLLNTVNVDRAIYLGNDDGLEQTVQAWAATLVGVDPTDDGVWRRAAELALYGTVDALDQFVAGERARLRLRDLLQLPAERGRTLEMVGDRVAIFVHGPQDFDEEDLLSADFLCFGRSEEPFIRRQGQLWLITPGRISNRSGVGVLDDEEDEVMVSLYTSEGTPCWREPLKSQRGARLPQPGSP